MISDQQRNPDHRSQGAANAVKSNDGRGDRAGPLPIMRSSGTGAEVMQRIAAPMIGGMISALLLSMLVIPAAWFLMRQRNISPAGQTSLW